MGHVFDFNEAIAYEQWLEKPQTKNAFELEAGLMRGLLQPMRGETILDIGCGAGACLKAFLDRFRRVRTTIPRGPLPANSPPPGPFNNDIGQIAVGLCYAGGSGNGTTSCCMNLERTLQICGFDVVDMIPVRRQNLEAKIKIMELTGEWLATEPSSSKCELEPI